MNYAIRCNEGAKTGPMNFAKALVYAERLKRLGNYNVELVVSK